MSKSKTLLIVNENASDNIGDHAINEGLINILNNYNIQCDVAPFATFNQSSSREVKSSKTQERKKTIYQKIRSIKTVVRVIWWLKNKNRIRRYINNEIDAVVIGGGQLLLQNDVFPLAMFLWTKYANEKDIPVYVAGVGCGESFSWVDIYLYQCALRKSSVIITRELASKNKIKEFFKCESECYPDLAFGLSPLESSISPCRGIVVGVTDYDVYLRYRHEVGGRSYRSFDSYIEAWLNRVLEILEDDEESIILLSTTYKDAACNEHLYELLKNRVNNPIELKNNLPLLEDYRAVLSRSRVVLSGRMHSLILGKIEGCSLEPWIISKKIENFLKDYNNENVFETRKRLKGLLEAFNL